MPISTAPSMQLGVDVQDVFDTMQIYLGSLYVNDFNKFAALSGVARRRPIPLASGDILSSRQEFEGHMVARSLVRVSETTDRTAPALQRVPFRRFERRAAPAIRRDRQARSQKSSTTLPRA